MIVEKLLEKLQKLNPDLEISIFAKGDMFPISVLEVDTYVGGQQKLIINTGWEGKEIEEEPLSSEVI